MVHWLLLKKAYLLSHWLTQEDVYDKMISNIREVKAREAVVIGIGMKGDEELSKHVDHTIYVPRANKFIAPILAVVPLQLLAYYAALHAAQM